MNSSGGLHLRLTEHFCPCLSNFLHYNNNAALYIELSWFSRGLFILLFYISGRCFPKGVSDVNRPSIRR